MRTNDSQIIPRLNQRGFTFFELVVVVLIISILAVVALNYYYKLLVDVERTSMKHDLGVMRSAVSMQVAGHFAAGNMVGLKELISSNPMDLLAEKPNNYLGVISHYQLEEIEKGTWFYDSQGGVLIYLVRNQIYFKTELQGPARIQFKIYPVYSDRKQKSGIKKYISGLTLRSLQPYHWLRPWG